MTINQIRKILNKLDEKLSENKIYLVGGAIRDLAAGRPVTDLDLALRRGAQKAARILAGEIKGSAFPLDRERGIYRVVGPGGGLTMDFSNFDGKNLLEDLGGRDYTLNAMAIAPRYFGTPGWQGKLIDPFGGWEDLKARKIRVVSEKALRSDPLRLLRGFRLAAELDFKIVPETLAAIKRRRQGLARCAAERVRDEIMKILATPRAGPAFFAMDRAGLLTVFFPEAEPMRRTARRYYGRGGVLDHSLRSIAALEGLLGRLPFYFPKFHKSLENYLAAPVGGYPRFALLKLAELLHDVGKPATAKIRKGKLTFYEHDQVGRRMTEAIGRRWRMSLQETRALAALVGAHMRPGNLGNQPVLTDRAIYRFFRDLGDNAVAMLIVSLADHFTYLSDRVRRGRRDPVFRSIKRMLERYFLERKRVSPPKIIDGRRLMKALKLKEGPLIGELLEKIREAQAAGRVKTTEEALALVKNGRNFSLAPRLKAE
jgi:tRNA nucleotidyltransferase/poly(A) polymerase